MLASILSQLLDTSRVRNRAGLGGFSTPLVHERGVAPSEAPFLVTGTKGAVFLPTRIRPGDVVWAGFADVSLDNETSLIQSLFDTIWKHGWLNRCTSVPAGLALMWQFGFRPETILLGAPTEVPPDIRVCVGSLRATQAILFAAPELVGSYTRSGSHLALTIHNANRALVVIDTHGVLGESRSDGPRGT